MIDFSVAVHTYNRANYICETIDSILNQTVKPKEIIVVDDGSTDNTEELLLKYKDNIKYIKIDNVGCGNSRKRSIDECQYEWVACCDDDDLWEVDHLEALVETIKKAPKAVFIFSNHTHIKHDGKPTAYNHFNIEKQEWWNKAIEQKTNNVAEFRTEFFLDLLTFNPANASSWAFKLSEYITMGGANEAYSRMNSEDADLTRRMSLQGKVAANSKITVKIRKHPSNMSISFTKNILGKAKMLTDYLDNNLLPDEYVLETIKVKNFTISSAFRNAFWEKDFKLALSIYTSSNAKIFTFKDKLRKVYSAWKI